MSRSGRGRLAAEASNREEATHPLCGPVVSVLWLTGAAGLCVALLLTPLNGEASTITYRGVTAYVVLLGVFLTLGVIGGVVAWRRPRNAVGWLFLAVFVLIGALAGAQEHAIYVLGVSPGALPGGLLAAWISAWAWYPALALFFIFVPLLFPTGRPPSPRWWVVGWVGGLSAAALTVDSALSQRLETDAYSVHNPLGVPGAVLEQGLVFEVAGFVFAVSVVAAVASLIVRFRRSRGVERQQLKWFVSAALVLPLVMLLDGLSLGGVHISDEVGEVLFALAISLLPIAAGFAILRYRLYDIDRIVSRTLAYTLLTGLLAGVYVTGVMLLGHLLRSLTGGTELAVAGSTLAVAALFGPLRRRLQTAVDRRFNRSRFDAERVVARFRARLRDEVDLDDLSTELRGTVHATVQPASASLWLRTEEAAR